MRQNDTQTDYDRFSKLEDPNDVYQALESSKHPTNERTSIGSHLFQVLLACTSYLLILELSHLARLPNIGSSMLSNAPIPIPDFVGGILSAIVSFIATILNTIGFAFSTTIDFLFRSIPGVAASGFSYVIFAISGLVVSFPLPRYLSAFSVTLIVIALVGKLLSLPLELMTLKSSRAQVTLLAALKRLEQQYGTDRERLAQEEMKLYKSAGVNPLAGCLPAIVQIFIFSGMWIAVQDMIMRSRLFDTSFLWIPALATCEPSRWCDAGRSVQPYPIPVLVLIFIMTNWDSKKTRVGNSETVAASNATRFVQNILTFIVALSLTAMPSAIVLYLVLQRWFNAISVHLMSSNFGASPRVDNHFRA